MTPQQRKALWICGGLYLASYPVRWAVDYSRQAAYYQQQAIRAAQQRAAAKARQTVAPHATAASPVATPAITPAPVPAAPSGAPAVAAAPARAVAPPATISGIWQGRTAITGRGICTLRIELHENEPAHFAGFSSLACANFAPLMAKDDRNPASATLNRMSPAAAVLSGTMENGSIRFHVDKTVSANSNGCAATSFTLTPFGNNQLAAAWQEEGCQGGQVILQKARS
jgi:hypothetical protein